ncbi:hypothetical protein PG994_006922 [Apiospora phragmitis]|uniref:Uncharacterized protein n=1 Tax=Apiospora phragmitis TaxID=2905665 RepID=A0ABR1VGE9_9PEZI
MADTPVNKGLTALHALREVGAEGQEPSPLPGKPSTFLQIRLKFSNFRTARPNHLLYAAHSVDDVKLMATHYAEEQPDGKFPRSRVHFLRRRAFADLQAERDLDEVDLPFFEPHATRLESRAFPRAPSPAPPRAPSTAPSTATPAPQQTSSPPKKQKLDNDEVCGWCNKLSHTIKSCAGPPGRDGTIAACALHNAPHPRSECREARGLWDLGQKYWWLVASRGNLPPLQYDEDWEASPGSGLSSPMVDAATRCRSRPNSASRSPTSSS